MKIVTHFMRVFTMILLFLVMCTSCQPDRKQRHLFLSEFKYTNITDSNIIHGFFSRPDNREKFLVRGSPWADTVMSTYKPLKFKFEHISYSQQNLDSVVFIRNKNEYVINHYVLSTGSAFDFYPYLTVDSDTAILHRPEFNSGYLAYVKNDTLISVVATSAFMKFSFFIPKSAILNTHFIRYQSKIVSLTELNER